MSKASFRTVNAADSGTGYVQNEAVDSYTNVHDAASGSLLSDGAFGASYIENGCPFPEYRVVRGFLAFDTTALSGATILAARLWLGFSASNSSQPQVGASTVHIVEGIQSIPLVLSDFGAHLSKTTSGGSKLFSELTHPFYIDLNSTGLTWINPGGITKLCLRVAGDIDSTLPGSGQQNKVMISGAASHPAAVTTVAASSVTKTSAMLNGLSGGIYYAVLELTYVGVASLEYPKFRFNYGLSTNYGLNTAWQSGLHKNDAFNAAILGLMRGQTYHFRAEGTNNASSDPHYGSDMTFNTDYEIRVTSIVDYFSSGWGNRPPSYKMELSLGGLSSIYASPMPDREPTPTLPTMKPAPEPPRLYYDIWITQTKPEVILGLFKGHYPSFAEWAAWWKVYGQTTQLW